jgi:phenylacetate-CoA ligase
MDLAYQRKRLGDVARGLRLSKSLARGDDSPRERLVQHQRRVIDELARQAAARSPFYRERFAGLLGDDPVELSRLPTLDKATMMDRFDDLVTDRRLRRDELLAHLDGLDHDALYLGEHRVMATSGSSGSKGIFVYDRAAWATIVALFLRFSEMAGMRPRIPRLRVAAIAGGSPTHMSRRGSATLAVGIHKMLPMAVTMPLGQIVERLNEFQPQWLYSYPSFVVMLAEEQRAGRLQIAPRGISVSSELCTEATRERIVGAFGVRPAELYATTEGAWGGSCEHGMHLYEDVCVFENVDEDGRPVPDGERGAKLLVTNLFNRVQPLIRFEISDIVTVDSEPCPCGRTLRRVRAIDGRADDTLRLAGVRGPVAVHPTQFAVVTADRDVREFQVVQEGGGLRLRVALREGAAEREAATRLGDRVRGRLAELGVSSPLVEVETCEAIERPASGKARTVVAGAQASPSSASASSVRSTSSAVV